MYQYFFKKKIQKPNFSTSEWLFFKYSQLKIEVCLFYLVLNTRTFWPNAGLIKVMPYRKVFQRRHEFFYVLGIYRVQYISVGSGDNKSSGMICLTLIRVALVFKDQLFKWLNVIAVFLQYQRRVIGIKDQHQLVLKDQQATPLQSAGMPLSLGLNLFLYFYAISPLPFSHHLHTVYRALQDLCRTNIKSKNKTDIKIVDSLI